MLALLFQFVVATGAQPNPSPDIWILCQHELSRCGNLQARLTPNGLDFWFDRANALVVFGGYSGSPLQNVFPRTIVPWQWTTLTGGDPLFQVGTMGACVSWGCPTMQGYTLFAVAPKTTTLTLRFAWVPPTGGPYPRRELSCTVGGKGTCPWDDAAVASFNTAPEPGTYVLMGTGLLGLGLVRLRGSRKDGRRFWYWPFRRRTR